MKKKWLLSLLAIVFILIAFTPKMLTLLVEAGAVSQIKAQSLSLSWFGKQEAKQLELFDDKNQKVFSCTHLVTSTSLWDLTLWKLNPFNKKRLIPSFLKDTTVEEGSALIQLLGYDPVEFKEMQLQLKGAELAATGKAGLGNFQIHANLGSEKIEAEAKLVQIPLVGLDQSMDLDLNMIASEKQIELALQAKSPQFSASVLAGSQGRTLVLKRPAILKGTLTPILAQKLSAYVPELKNFPLKEVRSINLEVSKFSLPFEGKTPDYTKMAVDLDLSASGVEFEALTVGSFQANISTDDLSNGIDFESKSTVTFGETFNIAFQGKYDPQESFLLIQSQSENSQLPKASFTWNKSLSLDGPLTLTYLPKDFKEPVQLTIEKLNFPSVEKWESMDLEATLICPVPDPVIGTLKCQISAHTLDQIRIDVQGDALHTAINASLHENTFKVNQPILFNYLLNPAVLQRFGLSLDAPTNVRVELEPFRLENFDWLKLQLKGSAQIDAFNLETVDIEKARLHFIYNVKERKVSAELSADVEQGNLSGSIAMDNFSLDPVFDVKDALFSADLDLSKFPSRLFGRYAPLIGDKADVHMKLSSDAKEQTLEIKAKSPQANINLALILRDHIVTLKKKPTEIRFNLTDEAYTIFDQLSPFEFTDPPQINLALSELSCGITPNWHIDWESLVIKGEALVDKCTFREKTAQKPITLKNFSLNFDHRTDDGPILFTLKSGLIAEGQKGAVSIVGKLDDMRSKDSVKAELDATFVKFPPAVLDLLARSAGYTDSPFTSLFGQNFDGTLTTKLQNWTGPLRLNLHSPNARVSVDGELISGTLTLHEPIQAQVLMTPEISTLFLEEVNPLSISGISSKEPITLEIGANGFSFPVYPFDASKLTIPNFRLDLGNLACRNEGNINVALGLLKSYHLGKGKDLHLWFTPIDCQIKQGLIHCERTEILIADTYEVAVWGTIDLVKDRVHMVLGLTASCLKKAFGIKDLPEGYVLQIPMTGRTNNVRINTKKATAKVALLLAWQQKDLAGAAAGGPFGAAVGGLLNKFVQLPDFDAKAPPAKRPFPWETSKK
jgi:hypothetical protein